MYTEVNTINIGNYNVGISNEHSHTNQCDSQCYLYFS